MPEKEGIVDRNRLLDIHGRRRNQQMALAKEFSINDYPCPAGGCLLTDKGFSARLKDLLKYKPDYNISDLHLLKIGRHFRISDSLKFIVGRDSKENEKLMNLSEKDDFIFDILDIPSAIGLARSRERFQTVPYAQKDIEIMASILARYSDSDGKSVIVSYRVLPEQNWENIPAIPANKDFLDTIRI
jgi:hypothetical protein